MLVDQAPIRAQIGDPILHVLFLTSSFTPFPLPFPVEESKVKQKDKRAEPQNIFGRVGIKHRLPRRHEALVTDCATSPGDSIRAMWGLMWGRNLLRRPSVTSYVITGRQFARLV